MWKTGQQSHHHCNERKSTLETNWLMMASSGNSEILYNLNRKDQETLKCNMKRGKTETLQYDSWYKLVSVGHCEKLRITQSFGIGWDSSYKCGGNRECGAVESSRRGKIWDANSWKLSWVLKHLVFNISMGRVFQRLVHLLDRMEVWTATFVFKKQSMQMRTSSDKSLIMSSSFWLSLLHLSIDVVETNKESCKKIKLKNIIHNYKVGAPNIEIKNYWFKIGVSFLSPRYNLDRYLMFLGRSRHHTGFHSCYWIPLAFCWVEVSAANNLGGRKAYTHDDVEVVDGIFLTVLQLNENKMYSKVFKQRENDFHDKLEF